MIKSYFMKHPVLAFLLIAGMLLTGSCKKVDYHQLTDDDMAWLVYENNQVDKFSNGNGDIVSYGVSLRTKTYDDFDDSANEFTTAYILQLNDTTAIVNTDSHGSLQIYKPDDNGLLVTLTWPHFPLKNFSVTSVIPTVANIGGVVYTDVYVIDAWPFTNARYYNKTIWYSKSEGVVQYEDTSGNTWVKMQ